MEFCCIVGAQNDCGKDFWLNKGMKEERRSSHIYRLVKNNHHIYKNKIFKATASTVVSLAAVIHALINSCLDFCNSFFI